MIECKQLTPSRRAVLITLLGSAAPWTASLGQDAKVAFPFYRAQHVLQGLYRHHLLALAQAFENEALALQAIAGSRCAEQAALAALREQWRKALLAWQRLATPGLGPVLKRRSQRQIDFWPARPALLEKALARSPRVLEDLATIGTPAKGFAALELLLAKAPDVETCRYIALLAEDIASESKALRQEFTQLAELDWSESEEAAAAHFAEWVNQWLGGWERLRWTHIEQPMLKGQTRGAPAAFARRDMATNQEEWRVQLLALIQQARWSAAQPPQPGQELIPIEALLKGKGHLAIASRWGQALDEVGQDFERLQPQSSPSQWLAFARKMKAVTTLYQNEVASALDIPLGFSDADGD